MLGNELGTEEGSREGELLGAAKGESVGNLLGESLGTAEGKSPGTVQGKSLGAAEGESPGTVQGSREGNTPGAAEGEFYGALRWVLRWAKRECSLINNIDKDVSCGSRPCASSGPAIGWRRCLVRFVTASSMPSVINFGARTDGRTRVLSLVVRELFVAGCSERKGRRCRRCCW